MLLHILWFTLAICVCKTQRHPASQPNHLQKSVICLQHQSIRPNTPFQSLSRAAAAQEPTDSHVCWNKGAGLRDKGVHLLSVLDYLDLIFLGDNIIPVRFISLISQHYWTPNMHLISCFHLIFNPLFLSLSLSFFPTPPILYRSCFFSVFQWGAVVSVSYCSQKMLLACRVTTTTSCCSTIYSRSFFSSFITVTWWTQPHHRDKENEKEKGWGRVCMGDRRMRIIWDVDSQRPKGQCSAG